MSTVSSIASPTANFATDPAVAARIPQKNLGQNDFLRLLATQFKTQDPMKPVEDTAFIAQMAQFTALQQSGTMSDTMTAMRADQQRATANSYLGHSVTVDDGTGRLVTGDVTAIDATGTTPQLVVNGSTFSLSAVLRVEPGRVSVPVTSPAGS